ncbi:MAG TPA: DMT family transporter [Candidatus Limnocylindria bacterium]|nr:DMT family transporter [Candidatus Limnocylindria bacterium]
MEPRGAIAAATTAMLYGSAYVATAIALEGFTPVGLAVWRGAIGALLVAVLLATPFLPGHRPRALGGAGLVRLGVMGIIGGGLFILAMNAAVAASGATITAFVAGLYAVLAAALAIPLLGEHLEARTIAALGAALVGTVMLSGIGSGSADAGGIALGLVAAAAFGTFLVLSRRWSARHRLTSPTVALSTLSISTLVALGVAAAGGDPLVRPDPPVGSLVALGWLAAGPGAAASVLVVIGMRRLPARHASAFLLLNPPTAALLAFVLLGETLDGLQLVGAALVLVAIAAASGALPTPGRAGSHGDASGP